MPSTSADIKNKMAMFLVLTFMCYLTGTIKADDSVQLKRSDDVSALQTLVEQQATLIQSLQAGLEAQKNENSAMKSQLADLKNRVESISKPVAFTVRFKADNATNGVSVANHSPLRFDDIVLNTGNGYDPQTGMFTAPVAGTYSFFLTQMGTGAGGQALLAIDKHGVTLDLIFCQGHEEQGSSQVTTHLGAGEQVWVRHEFGNAVRGGWYTCHRT